MASRQSFRTIIGAVNEMRNGPAPEPVPEYVPDWEMIATQLIRAVSAIQMPEFREADMSPVVRALSQIKPTDLSAIVQAISKLDLSPTFEVSNNVDTSAIAKAISQIKMTVNVPPIPKPAMPVAYEFTVSRDSSGVMTGVTAVPK